jgi:hypothetical protein
VGARQRAHLAAAGEKILMFQTVEVQHSGDRGHFGLKISSRNLTACPNPCKRSGFDFVPFIFATPEQNAKCWRAVISSGLLR